MFSVVTCESLATRLAVLGPLSKNRYPCFKRTLIRTSVCESGDGILCFCCVLSTQKEGMGESG